LYKLSNILTGHPI